MTKDRVLRLLKKTDVAVSGEEMSHILGISRMAISKAIASLKSEGYEIESRTNKGYRLISEPNVFSRTQVASYLEESDGLFFFEEIDSTNNFLKSTPSLPDGACAIAKKQTAGRGRRGHSFFSPSGIYLSVLIRPRCDFSSLSCLTAYAGVTVCEAITEVCGISPKIKWVNDILYKGRKIAGILTELSTEADSSFVESAVIGIGINTESCAFPDDIKDIAGSIADFTNVPIDKSQLAARVCEKVRSLQNDILEKNNDLMDKYRFLCSTVGCDVTVMTSPSYDAFAEKVDDDGSLIVRLKSGEERKISFGEISVKPHSKK